MLGWLSEKECKEEGYLYTEVSGKENGEGTLSSQQLPGQRQGTLSESLINNSPGQLLEIFSIRIYLCEGKKFLGRTFRNIEKSIIKI